MKIAILGGGLAGVSAAYFLQKQQGIEDIYIFEKEDRLGGLCRSFSVKGIDYDIGPHIIFSKDKEVLDLMNGLLGNNVHKLRRSNRIIHKQIWLQYPFENDLSKLPAADKDYCVNSFLCNPYEHYKPNNMLQFFLKTFGEGITNIYLRPYNEKIWKFDPSFMDTQMVERIPKPTNDEISRSASGETVDGYVHQLYFTYPVRGAIEAVLKGFSSELSSKVKPFISSSVSGIYKEPDGKFMVIANGKEFRSFDRIISTIPANLLVDAYNHTPRSVKNKAKELKYNSIIIAILNISRDFAKDNFAFMNAEKNIIFHRISKIDFLGANYSIPDSATYMVEITYRKGDMIDRTSDTDVFGLIEDGLRKVDFLKDNTTINFKELRRFEYAYVIYDIEHRIKMDMIKKYFTEEGVILNGRFGEFEYLNMDAVIRHSMDMAANFALN